MRNIWTLPPWILGLCAFMASACQPSQLTQIHPVYTDNQPIEEGHPLRLDFECHFANGRIRYTPGLSLFGLSWWDFLVWVEGGYFESGYIYPDLSRIYAQGNELRIMVSHRSQLDRVDTFTYAVPYPSYLELTTEKEAIVPGSALDLGLTLTYSHGQMFSWDDDRLAQGLQDTTIWRLHQGDKILKEPVVHLPHSLYYHRSVEVVIEHRWTQLSDTLQLPVDYRSRQNFDFSGKNGQDRQLNYPGQDGEDGQDVDLWVQREQIDGRWLLRIRALSEEKERSTLLALDGEGLVLDAEGGDGGDGGNGDDGDDGDDQTALEAAEPGEDGEDGSDGGRGGNGGRIRIYTDQATQAHLDMILLRNNGGRGGQEGDGADGGDGGEKLDGTALPDGDKGRRGRRGRDGYPGAEPRVILLEPTQLNRILTGLGRS